MTTTGPLNYWDNFYIPPIFAADEMPTPPPVSPPPPPTKKKKNLAHSPRVFR